MTITIARAAGLVTVQDLGRRGHMHEGVPPGGALVPELAIRANRAAGNDDRAPLIEVMGTIAITSSERATIATDDGARATLEPGATFTLASREARVRYVAFAGGLDVPEVLGGRGTLLCARLGDVLRAGDALRTRAAAAAPALPPSPSAHAPWSVAGAQAPVRVVRGPDVEAFAEDAFEALLATEWSVSADSDRVGTRLQGPALVRAAAFEERTCPMVRGAIEVPPSGQPIVLGPEHPTTGGYPLIGVVRAADLGRFFTIPLGGRVRFVRAGEGDPI